MAESTRLRDTIGLTVAPIEVEGFQRTYRRARIAANATALLGALTVGVWWADNRIIVLPTIAVLAAALLIHSYRCPNAPWSRMSRVDTPVYMVMFVMMGATAAIPFVAMSQAFIGFLFVRPATALRITVFYTVAAWFAIVASVALDMQDLSVFRYMILIVLTTGMTVVPAAWSLLSAAGEIVRHRRMRQALAAEKDELLAGKDRFVASISHELRTPLTSVVGLAHTLADPDAGVPPAERAELTRLLASESEEVASIVEDLLVVARAETGHLTLAPGVVSLVTECRAAAASIGIEIGASHVEPTTVVGDPNRIRQIVRNLLTNAMRYGGPNLRVDVHRDDMWGVVAVSDDGPGIPDDRLEMIFAAYGRAHDRPGQTDSVGLGLTVSRQLARLMGGDVVYSRRGTWTVFTLALPLADVFDDAGDVAAKFEIAG